MGKEQQIKRHICLHHTSEFIFLIDLKSRTKKSFSKILWVVPDINLVHMSIPRTTRSGGKVGIIHAAQLTIPGEKYENKEQYFTFEQFTIPVQMPKNVPFRACIYKIYFPPANTKNCHAPSSFIRIFFMLL